MNAEYLFVYGSLRPAARGTGHISGAAEARALLTEERHQTAATVRGQLISLGAYPGWVGPDRIAGSPLTPDVQGDIYQVDGEVLARLDVYEGCSAECPWPHEYRRCKAVAITSDGAEVEVWLYEYIGVLGGEGSGPEVIPTNDWLDM